MLSTGQLDSAQPPHSHSTTTHPLLDLAPLAPAPVDACSPEIFSRLLHQLVLDPSTFLVDHARLAFQHLAAPDLASPAQFGALLAALRLTGKDGEPSIVAACADVMRAHALAVHVHHSTHLGPVCDIVGTGGDGHNTFNVSTTAAIVAAGAGCKVYKVATSSRSHAQSDNG